jgi:hypothetical protein
MEKNAAYPEIGHAPAEKMCKGIAAAEQIQNQVFLRSKPDCEIGNPFPTFRTLKIDPFFT